MNFFVKNKLLCIILGAVLVVGVALAIILPITLKNKHTHAYTDTVIEATCTQGGYTKHECACGKSYNDTIVNALGHNYGAWQSITAATCLTSGEQKHICTRCLRFETQAVEALGHADANTNHACDRCDINIGAETRTALPSTTCWNSVYINNAEFINFINGYQDKTSYVQVDNNLISEYNISIRLQNITENGEVNDFSDVVSAFYDKVGAKFVPTASHFTQKTIDQLTTGLVNKDFGTALYKITENKSFAVIIRYFATADQSFFDYNVTTPANSIEIFIASGHEYTTLIESLHDISAKTKEKLAYNFNISLPEGAVLDSSTSCYRENREPLIKIEYTPPLSWESEEILAHFNSVCENLFNAGANIDPSTLENATLEEVLDSSNQYFYAFYGGSVSLMDGSTAYRYASVELTQEGTIIIEFAIA